MDYVAPSDAEIIAALAAMPVAQSTLDARAQRTREAAARPSYYWTNRTGGF